MSLKRDPKSPNSKFIRSIFLVKGIHFYGFHSSYSPFLKILIAEPTFVNRAVAIMQSGSVMSRRFDVYESHLPYILQFLSDFGLYGCGWLELRDVFQRGFEEENEQDLAPSEEPNLFPLSPHFRQSRMSLEVDVAAHQILNRHRLSARKMHHKLEINSNPQPHEPLVLSVRELWEDERERRRACGLDPSPEIPIDPSDSSRSYRGEWVSEARWWEEIRKRIEREKETEPPIIETSGWERAVMTTFESIEGLWEPEWRVWKPGGTSDAETQVYQSETTDTDPAEDGDIDVDVSMLSSQAMVILTEREEMEEEEDLDLEQEENLEDEEDPAAYDDDPDIISAQEEGGDIAEYLPSISAKEKNLTLPIDQMV